MRLEIVILTVFIEPERKDRSRTGCNGIAERFKWRKLRDDELCAPTRTDQNEITSLRLVVRGDTFFGPCCVACALCGVVVAGHKFGGERNDFVSPIFADKGLSYIRVYPHIKCARTGTFVGRNYYRNIHRIGDDDESISVVFFPPPSQSPIR